VFSEQISPSLNHFGVAMDFSPLDRKSVALHHASKPFVVAIP
jgi:hypothetical protein